MFLCSLIEELCTKEENDKTGCNFNFGHECSKSVLDMNNNLYSGIPFEKLAELKLDHVSKFKQLGNIESPLRTLQT